MSKRNNAPNENGPPMATRLDPAAPVGAAGKYRQYPVFFALLLLALSFCCNVSSSSSSSGFRPDRKVRKN